MKSVKVAIAANILVCTCKFVVAVIGGSATMLAEAIHSLADTANQALLWVGLERSKIGPSKQYPYGRGQERFVWGIISACGIFFLGAGVTIYHGIMGLIHPSHPEINVWTWLVLAVSLAAEGGSLVVAWMERSEADTANMAVLLEDSAAVTGIVLATLAIIAADVTGSPVWDAVGSIIVGLILAVIAVVLIRENLSYLVEKSSPPELQEQVAKELMAMPLVEEIKDIRMIVLTPDEHRLRAEVELNGYLLVREMEESLREDFEDIEDFGDFLQFCAAFANRVTRTVGAKIDQMEALLRRRLPFIKYIDIKPS